MSAFFVGQRVRCVRSLGGPCFGMEGRVVAVNASGMNAAGIYHGDGLEVDHGLAIPVIGPPSCWEPIVPEGMKPVEWSDCLWQPEGAAA